MILTSSLMIDNRGNPKGNTEPDGLRWIDHFSREKSSAGIDQTFFSSAVDTRNLVLISLFPKKDSLFFFIPCRSTEMQNT